jgi:molybdopterin-guanine dinucleotide biosynthesis adapter protein
VGAGVGPGLGPPVVAVSAAASGRGKTRWLEALTRELVRRGRRPGMVKHHPHGQGGLDPQGKDTERAARAGAVGRVLAEPGLLSLYTPISSPAALLEAAAAALVATTDVDVVLAEGFRDVPVPVRVWVGEGAPSVTDGLCIHVDAADSATDATVASVADRVLALWP